MTKALEVLATGKKRTKIAATLDGGNALISKQEVEIIEKELKALEIIKEKKVNVSLLSCSEWLDFYNQEIAYKEKELTKEEYDLLKEVLL